MGQQEGGGLVLTSGGLLGLQSVQNPVVVPYCLQKEIHFLRSGIFHSSSNHIYYAFPFGTSFSRKIPVTPTSLDMGSIFSPHVSAHAFLPIISSLSTVHVQILPFFHNQDLPWLLPFPTTPHCNPTHLTGKFWWLYLQNNLTGNWFLSTVLILVQHHHLSA